MSAVAGSRAALRRARREQQRRRVVLALAALLGLVLGITLLLVLTGGVAPQAAPRTLLLQVQAPDGTAAVSALVRDRDEGAGALVLPPDLDLAEQVLSRALDTTDPLEYRGQIATVVGADVDAGWVLDSETAQRLVDDLGGLQVDVDEPVARGGVPVLEAGPQRLAGRGAIAYATYRQEGESERRRLDRQEQVVRALLEALPEDPEPVLEALGTGSTTSAPVADLALVLSRVAEATAEGELVTGVLPTEPLGRLGSVPARERGAAVVREVLGEQEQG